MCCINYLENDENPSLLNDPKNKRHTELRSFNQNCIFKLKI